MANPPIPIPTTPKELYELLKLGAPKQLTEEDYKNFRYVIYARKSTTGDERQERSIPDQIKDCIEKVVIPGGLKVAGSPIEERQSAKDPDLRTQFNKLLDEVRMGRIDGIIAWHPDRLSRNMKEAGIIIDLLDKGILKDLRFATSTFENSPTGKMLLGMSFVLSKQYSEHLSESVARGNRRKTEDGKFFDDMKHGYIITDDGRLLPDGQNWRIIRELFEKRMGGVSGPDIAKWLNTERSDYRLTKRHKAPQPYKWDKDNVGKVLRDPVYAGVLKYGKSYSNLEEFYDFTPVVTVNEFLEINKVKDFSSAKLVSATMANKCESTKANLLRGIVTCAYCGKPFSSGLTPKNRKDGKVWYYFYRCETDGCEFKGKSIRAHFVLDYAYDFLGTHLFTTQSNYANFIEEARQDSIEQAKTINSSIMSLTNLIGNKNDEYRRAKDAVSRNPDLSKHYNLDEISGELIDMEKRLKQLNIDLKAMKHAPLTYAKYLELFQTLSDKLRQTDDMRLLDQILRKFFSNFTVKSVGRGKQQRCEITHKLNEPWDGFVKLGDIDRGRG